MNNVFLIGRLTKDPVVKYGAESQKAFCKFNIAIDNGKDKNGNEIQADFPSIIAFGKTAENLERYTHKGRLIAVTGALKTGKYEDKDGKTVFTTDVHATRVEFLDWGDDKPTEKGFSQVEDDDIPF